MNPITGKYQMSFRWWMLFGMLALALLPACTAGPGNARRLTEPKSIPAVSGIAECELVNDSKPLVRLDRAGGAYDMAAPKGFSFFPRDVLSNTAQEIVRLSAVKDEATFALKPGSSIEFQPGSLILGEGTTRLEFTRVNGVFRIQLPVAVLAIRGTRLDVTVNPDKSSRVELLEGKIGIIGADGVETRMEAGNVAEIPAQKGGKITFSPLGDVKGMFEGLSEDQRMKTIR